MCSVYLLMSIGGLFTAVRNACNRIHFEPDESDYRHRLSKANDGTMRLPWLVCKCIGEQRVGNLWPGYQRALHAAKHHAQ